MAASKEQVAAQPGAAGDSMDSDAAIVDEAGQGAPDEPCRRPAALRAKISALESKHLFLERVIKWHETRLPSFAHCDLTQEGANLLSLRTKAQFSSDALSLALSEERNSLLRF